MTYQYSDIDQHEALYNLARRYPGSIEALAYAMGRRQNKTVSPNVLRNKLRPGIETHFLNAEEFSLVVELCQEAGVEGAVIPLQAMCWRHGLVAMAPPPAGQASRDIFARLGGVSREFADLVSEATAGAADGRINAAERERIHKEALEVMQAVMALTMSIDVVAEQGAADSV
ncbi:phage regulatory CII family protein [Cupriavidus taiwanensis]|uniref:phage regulatory CII family protein n=1 Tax=Cupriavidus taiwanensis TaxID=164546 RepID=UPI0039C2F0BD